MCGISFDKLTFNIQYFHLTYWKICVIADKG